MTVCSDEVDGGLRRMYTRSIPTALRPISLLERSMCDAQQQWEAVVATLVEDPEGYSRTSLRAALSRVEKIANQTKAIKQELIPYMNCNPTEKKETFESFFASVMTSPTASSTPNANGESFRASRLAARVWMWSLSFATVLSDMELLSGSLSFAVVHAKDIFAGEFPTTEASAFFLGEETTRGAASPRDEDVLRACELLYHLYTGDDDAAAECLAHRLLDNEDTATKKRDDVDDMPVQEDFFRVLSRVVGWVATDDHAALGAFALQRTNALPPLVQFFMQSMQEMVVHRRLVQMGLHSVWRPVIDMEAEAIGKEMGEGNGMFADSPRLQACAALQRESLPRRLAWPLPTPLAAGCFPITQ